MKTPEIARQLRMGERPVREWLKQGTFPEAKKRRVAGKAPLMPLHALCFHALKLGKETVWRCGEQSRNKATREEARTVYRYLETLKQAEGKRISQSTAHPEVCSERRHSGSLCVIGRAWMRWSERTSLLFARRVPHSRRRMTSFWISC
jgi:hypothetical protein